jgi:hypothetical protein
MALSVRSSGTGGGAGVPAAGAVRRRTFVAHMVFLKQSKAIHLEFHLSMVRKIDLLCNPDFRRLS